MTSEAGFDMGERADIQPQVRPTPRAAHVELHQVQATATEPSAPDVRASKHARDDDDGGQGAKRAAVVLDDE